MKKTIKYTILLLTLAIGFSGCRSDNEELIPLTQGNPESATIAHNTTHTFTLEAATGGVGIITHQWQSSADNVSWTSISGATSPNFTTPVLTENTYFRRQATASNETIFSASARITVTAALTQGNPENATINTGETHTFTLAVATGGLGDITHQWQSSADNVSWTNISGATSPNFTTPALTENTYFRRQATAGNETIMSTSALITINFPVTDVTLNTNAITLLVGENATLTVTVLPENATNPVVTWHSNNEAVASVDADGNITAHSVGIATVSVTTEDGGLSASCIITVDCNTTDEGVVINGVRWATRNVGTPGTFAANHGSAGAFYQWNRKVAWSTSDPMQIWNPITSFWENTATWDRSAQGGTTWYPENDPCPNGWRVPTNEELRSLGLGTSILARNARVLGFNTDLNGRIFPSGANSSNGIFLPAVGNRATAANIAGRLNAVDMGGSYWSSMGVGNGNAWVLQVGGIPGTVSWAITSRDPNHGFSIRCVAK